MAAELPPRRSCRRSFGGSSGGGEMEEKGILLPELSCRLLPSYPCQTAAEAVRPPSKPSGGVLRELNRSGGAQGVT
ncbi:unnamed protein product [Boreogadus saida]